MPNDAFPAWCEAARVVAATTRTSEKRAVLAAYLRTLQPDDLAIAATFFGGRPLAATTREPLGVGWRGLQAAVEEATGAGGDALSAAYDRTSDPGDAAALVMAESVRGPDSAAGAGAELRPGADPTAEAEPAPEADLDPAAEAGPAAGAPDPTAEAEPAQEADLDPAAEAGPAAGGPDPTAEAGLVAEGRPAAGDRGPSLREVADAFVAIGEAAAAGKAHVLAGLLARCDPSSARFVVRIVTGELRIGLRDGLLDAAIAEAFGRPAAAVSRARMLTGDAGRTAVLAHEGLLGTATLDPFRPVGCMLASPAEDAAEIVRRLGPTVWVEDKYDGVRVQLHRRGDEVRLFSRDLNDVTGQFPEIAEGARGLAWDGILDGEVVAFADGAVLPFLRLQARLGRKAPSRTVLADVPVVYVAFDVLALGPRDGRIDPLLDEPLTERRRRLEALGLPDARASGRFVLSHLVSADSVDALEGEFSAARARRNEGLMVKDPASPYSPGRRGLGWLKMKKALATIDCVVVGVEVGHGKRHGVLSDWTFAVRDEEHGTLVTIGKAYTGLTDAELAEMTAWFTDHTISVHGRYRVVEPQVVVEIAFDVIQRSPRHRSGFALRFPRIAHLRRDKSPADADTLATVERLFTELQHGAEHLVAAGGAGGPARTTPGDRPRR